MKHPAGGPAPDDLTPACAVRLAGAEVLESHEKEDSVAVGILMMLARSVLRQQFVSAWEAPSQGPPALWLFPELLSLACRDVVVFPVLRKALH